MDEMVMFRKNALLENLCSEWNGMWSACHNDKEKLMRLVLMRQSAPYFADFCYRGKGLSREYCLKEFGDFVNGRVFNDVDGVEGFTSCMYVSPSERLKITTNTTQMLWCCGAYVEIPLTKCPTLYISNHSNVHITCDGFNYVRVYLFDDSVVTLDEVDEDSGITIFEYSDDCKVERGRFCLSNKVKEFRKELVL